MGTLIQDIRYGFRMLVRNPGFTIVVVLVLAMGIGANTAIFSVVNAVFLRPIPVREPAQLVSLFSFNPEQSSYSSFSYPEYVDFRDNNKVFSGLVAIGVENINLSSDGSTERIWGGIVSGNYFSVLGLKPALGRFFMPEEDQTPGSHPVVVLSYDLWQRRFGSDPGLVGKTVTLSGYEFTVVGVAPKGFKGVLLGLAPELWVPLMMHAQVMPTFKLFYKPHCDWLVGLIGRLKPGVIIQQAQMQMETLGRQIEQKYSGSDTEWTVMLQPASKPFTLPNFRGPIQVFMGLLQTVVLLVLLIVCSNVASLLAARSYARQSEIGIRLALGASRGRLTRQLLTESLLLSLVAGCAGLLLAIWTFDFLNKIRLFGDFPISLDVRLDIRVFAFTMLLSILAGVIFSLIPTIHCSKPDLVRSLKGEMALPGRGPRRFGLRNLLVISQVALSLFLLIVAGLFIKSLKNQLKIDLGFKTDDVLLMSYDLGLSGYSEAEGREFHQQLVERIETLPGVQSVSLTRTMPLGIRRMAWDVRIEGSELGSDEYTQNVSGNVVGLDYFRTIGIPLLRGRDFDRRDRQNGLGVTIINETMARRFWPGENPIGKRLSMGSDYWLEVIGIVKDSTYRTLHADSEPHMYIHLSQHYQPKITLLARSSVGPKSIAAALRHEVQTLDKDLPVFDIKTLKEHVNNYFSRSRMITAHLSLFGLLSLLLASIGIYGITANYVTQRTHEIGVRMALGAQASDVLKLVLRQGLFLILSGLFIGLVLAIPSIRLVSSLLSLLGVNATDPMTFVSVPLLLAVVALVSCWLPARRATRIDPMAILRYE